MIKDTLDKHKLLIIGLDGGTLDLIKPWAKAGLLPTLARLINEGVSARLRSTIPVISPAAWTTMITGKNPGKHGIYDFIRRRPDSYHLQYVQPNLPRMGTIFNRLSQAGRRVGVMGVPSTYPPEPVNGFMIAGPWAPQNERCVYPTDMFPYLMERGYEINNTVAYTPETAQEFAQYLAQTTEVRASVALELWQREPWDLFMVVFRDTDTVAHMYWQDTDPTYPSHDPARVARLGNVILDHYRQLDRCIGSMLETIDDQTWVMVVSDHGAGPLYAEASINKWLLDEGLLTLKKQGDWQDRYRQMMRRLGMTRSGIIARLGWPLANRLKRLLPDWAEQLFPWPHAQLIEQVDWTKTKAYSFGSIGQIHINLRGREPQGIVAPGAEYEAVVSDIIERLERLTDPRTGRRVKVEVWRRESLYHGPYAEQGPDLNIILDDMSCITHITLDAVREDVIGPPADYETGTHRLYGMLILWGPGVRPGVTLDPLNMVDVAPMAMYVMGEAVPQDMDGRVLTTAFDPQYLASHPVQGNESAFGEMIPEESPGWTLEEEEKMFQHLKSLGYLG